MHRSTPFAHGARKPSPWSLPTPNPVPQTRMQVRSTVSDTPGTGHVAEAETSYTAHVGIVLVISPTTPLNHPPSVQNPQPFPLSLDACSVFHPQATTPQPQKLLCSVPQTHPNPTHPPLTITTSTTPYHSPTRGQATAYASTPIAQNPLQDRSDTAPA